jgi:methionyl-tRNA formyltransferase
MKFAYFGHDLFTPCMKILIGQGFELIKLFTWRVDNVHNFNDTVLDIALKAKAPVQMSPVTPKDMQDLRELGCAMIVSAGYPQRLPPWENTVRYGVNVHPSLLPHGRGPMPLPRAIIEGATEWGTTVHKLSPEFDAGDILTQERFDLTGRESLEVLLVRCQLAAARAMYRFITNIDDVWAKARPQGEGTYWQQLPPELRRIDWTMNVETIDRIIRASGRSEVTATVGTASYYISAAQVWQESHGFTPGNIAHTSPKEIVVAATDGFVCLTSWSPASAEMRARFRL